MDAMPRIDYDLARRVGVTLAPPGPRLTRRAAEDVVAGLRVAAAASVGHVAEVTGLPVPVGEGADGGMLVIDRGSWVRANVAMVEGLLAEACPPQDPDAAWASAGLGARAGAAGNAAQLGGLLALLAGRVLGQYLPHGPGRPLVLVAPNVAKIERALGVDHRDFRLWVCLHEQTHRFQFSAAPWLAGWLARQLGDLIAADGDRAPGRAWRLPTNLVEALTTPAQRVVFDRLTAVMSLLEGYADVMMDRVGPDVVPTVATIRARFERHRDRPGLTPAINRLLGMDLKLAQYRDGARFCRTVIDAVGVPGLNAVYESAGLLPSLAEIRAPQEWLARVHPSTGSGTDGA